MLTTFAFGEIFWAQRQPFSGMSNLVFYCLAFDKVLITLLGAKINVTTKQSGHWHCLIYRCMAVWLCAQPCLTLYDPMDDSLPGSSVHGIFQARILPFPIPGDLPDPGMEPASLVSPASTGGFFTISITDIGVQVSLYIQVGHLGDMEYAHIQPERPKFGNSPLDSSQVLINSFQ